MSLRSVWQGAYRGRVTARPEPETTAKTPDGGLAPAENGGAPRSDAMVGHRPNAVWPQVAARLRDEIVGGHLVGRLPGMRDLAARYEVSFPTIQRAIEDLTRQGLVVVQPRSAMYAVPPAQFNAGQLLRELTDTIDRLTRLRDEVATQLEHPSGDQG